MKLMKGLFEMDLLEALKLYTLTIPIVVILVGLGAIYFHNNI